MPSTQRLLKKFYGSSEHPYITFENKINSTVKINYRILDAGCGRDAQVLKKFAGKGYIRIGVDLEEFTAIDSEIKYIKSDISKISIKDESVDIVISRAVLEHIKEPFSVYREIHRILKPGGRFIFLVPNLGDYVSLLSLLIPNKYHSTIISKLEGRKVEDVFPVYYKSNSFSTVRKLSRKSGFRILDFHYLGQYPSVLMFNSILFFLGTIYEKFINKFSRLGFLRAWILVDLEKI